ncbi:hypothetical protein KUCAC02_016954 [Chaenocephalus aceratus]|nr:hypothetical protein KUCAC02_016954 [Chaenocephalus aceratus]
MKCLSPESALLSARSMVAFLKHIRRDKASSAVLPRDGRPAPASELGLGIEPVSDSLTFSPPHALLM